MTRSRRTGLTTIAVTMALLCVACAPSTKGSEEEHVADVVAAVKAADPRVVTASAEKSTSGMASGWVVDVVLSGTGGVSADELGQLLLAARHAGDRDPAHVDLFAKDEKGSSLDLAAAADELGVRYTSVGAGIGVMRSAIDETLGARE